MMRYQAPGNPGAFVFAGYNWRMQILLNGKHHELDCDVTIAALLEHAGFGARRVAVEVNREIVPRADHPCRRVHGGDAIEIVHFVGGGE